MGWFSKKKEIVFDSAVCPNILWEIPETIDIEQATALIEWLLSIRTKNMSGYLRIRQLINQNNLWQQLEDSFTDPAYSEMLWVLSDVNHILHYCKQAPSVTKYEENLIQQASKTAGTVADVSSDYLVLLFVGDNYQQVVGGNLGGGQPALVSVDLIRSLQQLAQETIQQELETNHSAASSVIPILSNQDMEQGLMLVENLYPVLKDSGLTFSMAVVHSAHESTVITYQ